jgi:ATP-dependent Lhr-like helicase
LLRCAGPIPVYAGHFGEGFDAGTDLQRSKSTNCFAELTEDEWQEMLYFITAGGAALQQYDEYKKVEMEDGVYKMNSRRMAMRHRMHIGTIVSDSMMKVKFMTAAISALLKNGLFRGWSRAMCLRWPAASWSW